MLYYVRYVFNSEDPNRKPTPENIQIKMNENKGKPLIQIGSNNTRARLVQNDQIELLDCLIYRNEYFNVYAMRMAAWL